MPALVLTSKTADVVVVGGGPIGSLVAYQLARFGLNPYIVEQDDKPNAPIYGRATTLWPRSVELFDALGLADNLLQRGVVSKTGVNFRHGKSVPGGLDFAQRMDRHADTRFQFALHLRQRLTEQAIEQGFNDLGHEIHFQHKLVSWTEDESADYPVRCLMEAADESEYEVHCKYLVGADGGKSPVRKAAKIPFVGEGTGASWIRMDALVKTDMPLARQLNSVQSDDHGVLLWAPLDDGRTRIGYVFNKELQAKYGEAGVVAEEVAIAEAKKAAAPFTLDFIKVDWVTLYGISQRMATTFKSGRVILAGDSAHTHSSGSAQGLNTGTFDATNLAWKLALDIKGLAKGSLLDTYDEERRVSVGKVIDNDVIISSLIGGKLPPKFAERTEDPREILREWFASSTNQLFTLGLGVSYPSSNLINRETTGWPLSTILPGQRGPDCKVSRVGTAEPVWLQRILVNDGRFNLIVFTGDHSTTRPSLDRLQSYFASSKSITKRYPSRALFRFATIIAGEGIGAEEYVGVAPIGMPYFDPLRTAHEVYGIDMARGAIVVFRPDGWVGTVVGLDSTNDLGNYFAGFLVDGAGA